MKVSKKKLEDKLNRLIDVYTSKIHLKNFAIKYFSNKNLSEEKIISILNRDIPLEGVSEAELYYLTRIFTLAQSPATGEFVVSEHDRLNIKSEEYFTPLEIQTADEYKGEKRKRNVDSVFIPNVREVQPNCYFVILSYKELIDLYNDGWVKYDFATQREASLRLHKGKIIKSVKIYDDSMFSIRDTILVGDGKFTPNLLTLNIPDNGISDFRFERNGLKIMAGTKLSVIDGFHRILGTLRAYEQDQKIKGFWYISILNYTIEAAQEYIEREDKRNKISEKHLLTYKQDDSCVNITQKLNTNGNSKNNSMFSKIATNTLEISNGNKYTLFDVVVMALRHTFDDKSTKKKEILKPLDITLIAKYLVDGFNWIIGLLKQFENPKENNDISTHPHIFAFYIVILYDLYQYYQDKDDWENKLMNKISSIDFSLNNKIWSELGILDKNINKSSITKMKKHLLKERELVSVNEK